MDSPRSKLVLPTVDTCPWRLVRAGSARAECGLVATWIGVASEGLAAVSDDTCAACCRSFPPTRRKLNPVVASLLHRWHGRVRGRRRGPCQVVRG
jgi:hypothetical protein